MKGLQHKRRWAATLVVLMSLSFLAGSGVAYAKPASGLSVGDVNPLIVGGTDATMLRGEVSLQLGGGHRCGGVLLTKEWVFTVGHCSTSRSPDTQVRTGSLLNGTGGELVGVKQAGIIYPGYELDTFSGDYALVPLKQRVKAQPARMFIGPLSAPVVGASTEITGWGRICEDPAVPACTVPSPKLKRLDTVVAHPSFCYLGETEDGRLVFDPKAQICVKSADGQPRMACNGDSGSPQFRKIGSTHYVVGLTLGDGDDYGPRPNGCTTRPDGGAGSGIWGRTNLPEVWRWIVRTLLLHDPVAAQEFVKLNPEGKRFYALAG